MPKSYGANGALENKVWLHQRWLLAAYQKSRHLMNTEKNYIKDIIHKYSSMLKDLSWISSTSRGWKNTPMSAKYSNEDTKTTVEHRWCAINKSTESLHEIPVNKCMNVLCTFKYPTSPKNDSLHIKLTEVMGDEEKNRLIFRIYSVMTVYSEKNTGWKLRKMSYRHFRTKSINQLRLCVIYWTTNRKYGLRNYCSYDCHWWLLTTLLAARCRVSD